MPRRQLEKAISSELGAEWRSKVAEFDDEPLAAASIGQVPWCSIFAQCSCCSS